MNNCELRHVCFKDLEKYWRKDDYFEGLNENEKEKIKINLGLDDNSTRIFTGPYELILYYRQNNLLEVGSYYIINDFRTIYECNNLLFGLSNNPSEEYILLLTPINQSEFSLDVRILNHLTWEAKYDISKNIYRNGSDMGKILYLKDEKNNSAYYDFKNIKFFRSKNDLSLGEFGYTSDKLLLTFNGVSENTHLGPKCTDIVIIGNSINNTFDYKCSNITILDNASNNTFDSDTRNVIFTKEIKNCLGKLHDIIVSDVTNLEVPKKFISLGLSLAIQYLDSDTLTNQFYYL